MDVNWERKYIKWREKTGVEIQFYEFIILPSDVICLRCNSQLDLICKADAKEFKLCQINK